MKSAITAGPAGGTTVKAFNCLTFLLRQLNTLTENRIFRGYDSDYINQKDIRLREWRNW